MSETAERSRPSLTGRVMKQVCSGNALPSVPAVALQVINQCRDPDVDFGDLAALISADSALTARLLRIANTSEFCGRRRISSLPAALCRLGLRHTRALVLGFAFASELQRKMPEGFDIEGFWRNSLATSQAGRTLARRVRPRYADNAFSAGLLQDVGILALRCALGSDYADVLDEQAAYPTRELHEIELRQLSTSHMAIGSRLLATWGLPSEVHRPVLYHHSLGSEMPEDLSAPTKEVARILALGDLVARVFNDPDRNISYQAFLHGAGEVCGLTEQAARDVLREVRAAVEETAEAFDVDPDSMPSHEEIQAMAGQSIARLHAEMGEELNKFRARMRSRGDPAGSARSVKSAASGHTCYDEITGVLTRSSFAARLENSLRRALGDESPLALIVFDVDHLGAINRDRGRARGDDVLRLLSEYIDGNLQPTETIGRGGGDKLAVLLPDCEGERTLARAEALRRGTAACSREWLPGAGGITVSVGVVVVQPSEELVGLQAVLEKADMCVCVAKTQGRNCTRHATV